MSDTIVHQQEGLFTGLLNPRSRKNMRWNGAGISSCVKCGLEFSKKSGAQKQCTGCATEEKKSNAYKGPYALKCTNCQKDYTSKLKVSKYCSKTCKNKARHEKDRLTGKDKERQAEKAKRARQKYRSDEQYREKIKQDVANWIYKNKEKHISAVREYREKMYSQDPLWKAKQHKEYRANKKVMTLEQYEQYCNSRVKEKHPSKPKNLKGDHTSHVRAYSFELSMGWHVNAYKSNNIRRNALDKYYVDKNIPELLAKMRLRTRLRQVVKRAMGDNYCNSVTCAKLGYTPKMLLDRLISTLPNDASMDDFMSGRLHIDHIRPCASFDLSDPEQIKQAYSLDNMQLLWANDNLSKNSRWNGVLIRKSTNNGK